MSKKKSSANVSVAVDKPGLVPMQGSDLWLSLRDAQREYIQEFYRNGGKSIEAYQKAYNPKDRKNASTNATVLMNNPRVREAMRWYVSQNVNKDTVLTGMARLANYAEKESDQIKAYSKLGKWVGLEEGKSSGSGDGTVNVNVNIGLPKRGGRVIDAEIVDE